MGRKPGRGGARGDREWKGQGSGCTGAAARVRKGVLVLSLSCKKYADEVRKADWKTDWPPCPQ